MAATTDERNFRSSYYEKVGFRNVEEKKSLEILLKEKSLDKAKLNHFCLRFPVPGIHRSYLWKLLLGVLPLQVTCHDYVWSCREQSFNDLARQMRVLKLDTASAPHNIVVMWLLETGQVPTGCKDPLTRNAIYENFAKLATIMMEFFDNDVEVYWVSKALFNFLTRLAIEMPKFTECSHSLLEKEDPELYNFMLERELLSNVPFFDWYTSMFALVLNESSLCKIWDKIVGSSYKVLIFVGVSLIMTLKKSILTSDTLDNLLLVFENVTEEVSEVVVTKALDLWQQHSNSINIGLEFSVKHNPTALWAAQHTFSMPNLGATVQPSSGLQERVSTVPSNLHICSYSCTELDGLSSLDAVPFQPVPANCSSPVDDSNMPSQQEVTPNVLLLHLDQMTRVLSELRNSEEFLQSSREGRDEPWMNPLPEPDAVQEIIPVVLSTLPMQEEVKKATVVFVDEEKQEEDSSPTRNLLYKLMLMLAINGMTAAAIVCIWLFILNSF